MCVCVCVCASLADVVAEATNKEAEKKKKRRCRWCEPHSISVFKDFLFVTRFSPPPRFLLFLCYGLLNVIFLFFFSLSVYVYVFRRSGSCAHLHSSMATWCIHGLPLITSWCFSISRIAFGGLFARYCGKEHIFFFFFVFFFFFNVGVFTLPQPAVDWGFFFFSFSLFSVFSGVLRL